jgi:hypothetical protein
MTKRIYTNLPVKNTDSLRNSIDQLTETNYVEPHEFHSGEYDATVGFFVKRGFERGPAEQLTYVILQQAKIDNINSQEVLDKLGTQNPATLNEVVTMIFNANRFKSSALGNRSKKITKDFVSRNILG